MYFAVGYKTAVLDGENLILIGENNQVVCKVSGHKVAVDST